MNYLHLQEQFVNFIPRDELEGMSAALAFGLGKQLHDVLIGECPDLMVQVFRIDEEECEIEFASLDGGVTIKILNGEIIIGETRYETSITADDLAKVIRFSGTAERIRERENLKPFEAEVEKSLRDTDIIDRIAQEVRTRLGI